MNHQKKNRKKVISSPSWTDTRFYYVSRSIVAGSQANCTKFEHVGAMLQTSNRLLTDPPVWQTDGQTDGQNCDG